MENHFRTEFLLYFITNDPSLARQAEMAGVERIGPDLEILGKESRQKHPDAQISRHKIEDIPPIRSVLKKSEVFVRINPIHSHSEHEINRVLESGAQVIMLPMFRTSNEVSKFITIIRGRAKTVLLLETPEAMMRIDEILSIDGINEVHFGLNDLHLGLKLHSRFEVLCSEVMDALATAVQKRNLPFGFGAVGRPDDSTLPIPPDQVIAEIIRLGSSRTFLSRYFFSRGQNPFEFDREIRHLRDRISYWKAAGIESLQKNSQALRESVRRYRNEHPGPVGKG
jgi:HpcH/HpaI aldolase/citrate lyase family